MSKKGIAREKSVNMVKYQLKLEIDLCDDVTVIEVTHRELYMDYELKDDYNNVIYKMSSYIQSDKD